MKRMLQTASRGAMIALIAATPVVAYAQDENATDEPTVAQQEEMAPEATDGATSDVATDDTAAPADTSENVATDESAADGEDAGTDVATDEPATGPITGEDGTETDMAADEAPTMDAVESGEQMAAEEPAKPVEGQITMQDADTVLAEDLLGATVYNGSDENVGDINDLIIGLNGDVKGVVIGVGGFLGLGEKHVAVEMAALDVIDQDGSPRLVTTASKADLEAAPAFVSAKQQASDAQQLEMESTNDTMGGTMGGTAQPTE